MKLSITLITALVGAVTAIPAADPQPGVSVAAEHLDVLMKRNDCVPKKEWLCNRPNETACVCNQGKTCKCMWVDKVSPGGNLGAWIWGCYNCPKPNDGGLQCEPSSGKCRQL